MYFSSEKSKTLGKSLHLSPIYTFGFLGVTSERLKSCGRAAVVVRRPLLQHGCCPGFQTHWTKVRRNRAVNTNKDFITGTESQWDGCPEGARQRELSGYLFDRISTKRQSWDAVRETDHHTFQWKCISDFPWHFADKASVPSVALHLFLRAEMSAVMVGLRLGKISDTTCLSQTFSLLWNENMADLFLNAWFISSRCYLQHEQQ